MEEKENPQPRVEPTAVTPDKELIDSFDDETTLHPDEESKEKKNLFGIKIEEDTFKSLREDYTRIKKEIILRYGKPSWHRWKPVNKAAKKIVELKRFMAKRRIQRLSAGRLREVANAIVSSNEVIPFETPLPEELLVPFNGREKDVIREYFSGPNPSATRIAETLEIDRDEVFTFINCQRFAVVKQQILTAFKESLPYEALVALRECLRSDQVITPKLTAALAVLEDAGYLKRQPGVEVNITNDLTMDPLVEEELRKLGDRLANEKRPVDEVTH